MALLICERCGHTGKGRKHAPGSFLIEIVLWVAFCVPGLIYTIWRHHAALRVCDACSRGEDVGTLLPLDSPRGQRLLRQYENDD